MMRASIFLLLFLSSCSLTDFEKKFLENIEGTYIDANKEKFFIFKRNRGDFELQGVQYTLKTIISETSATYLKDDVLYTGIFYRVAQAGKMRLMYLDSTDATEEGVKTGAEDRELYQLASKE